MCKGGLTVRQRQWLCKSIDKYTVRAVQANAFLVDDQLTDVIYVCCKAELKIILQQSHVGAVCAYDADDLVVILNNQQEYTITDVGNIQYQAASNARDVGLLRSVIPTSVSMYVTRLRCSNMAQRIEVLLGIETLGDPRNIVLDGSSDSARTRCGLRQIILCPFVALYDDTQRTTVNNRSNKFTCTICLHTSTSSFTNKTRIYDL